MYGSVVLSWFEGVRFDQRMRCTAQSYFHGYLEGVELMKLSHHDSGRVFDLCIAVVSEAGLEVDIE